jgi:tRNA(Ile)-lysidine synthase
VHELAARVLGYIRRQEVMRAGDRVGVAVSGGIDSVALLRLLLELREEIGIVVSAVHFNHKLRGAESDADQEFVAKLAQEHGLEFHCESGDVARHAAEERSGVEAAARELRYGFFRRLLGSGEDAESTSRAQAQIDAAAFRSAESAAPPQGTARPAILLTKVATGHTLDDQAETVLMRLIRGTGLRGLAGIYPRLEVEDEDGESCGEIIRPLLGIRHFELRQYLNDLKQKWREDSTNADVKFTRNRVRQLVLPLLERDFNPAIAESLSELAEIARGEEDYWENEISGWLGTVVQWSRPEWDQPGRNSDGSQSLVQIQTSSFQIPSLQRSPLQGSPQNHPSNPELLEQKFLDPSGPPAVNASISRAWLLSQPAAVQRRALKAVADYAGISLEFKHVEEILRFAAEPGPAGKELSLPLGWRIVRELDTLVLVAPDPRRRERSEDYEYSLALPGRAIVPELDVVIEALVVTSETASEIASAITTAITPESQGAEYNPQQLLRAELLPKWLIVRNWRAGDRFWPAHTKAPKKIKELLQERHIAQPERRLWPVAASGNEIVWMRGFAVPASLRAKPGQKAVLIREMPWVEECAI